MILKLGSISSSLGTNTIRLSSADGQDTSADSNNTAPTDTLMYLGTGQTNNQTLIGLVIYGK